MSLPLMPKAIAVWLVDNTSLTFDQIAEFTGMHPLEVSGIADGEVAVGLKGQDPVLSGELLRDNIAACEADPKAKLKLAKKNSVVAPAKRKGPKYTPLSKRQERPAASLWLIRNHPELTDGQISKLVGTTKPTIMSLREKTHWNYINIQPIDPVALGMCKQLELDEAVAKAAPKAVPRTEETEVEGALLDTDLSLADEVAAEPEVELSAEALFADTPAAPEEEVDADLPSAEDLFNLSGDAAPDTDANADAETSADEDTRT